MNYALPLLTLGLLPALLHAQDSVNALREVRRRP